MAASPVDNKSSKEGRSANCCIAALLPALRRLDRLLEWAMQTVPTDPKSDASDPFHGLFLSRGQVACLLTRQAGDSSFRRVHEFARDDPSELAPADSPLSWLIQTFGLSTFEADLVILARAPEVDLKYEKTLGYLQDDVTRRRPTVELALNLLCASAEEKLEYRHYFYFSSSGSLIRNQLLHIVPDPNQVGPPYLAHYLKLDEQVTQLLLGRVGLDSRLTFFCQILHAGGSSNQFAVTKRFFPACRSLDGVVHARYE